MKRCKACGEEFHDQFRFCPVDGKPLAALAVINPAVAEFHLTLIDDQGLGRRLTTQLSLLARQFQSAWASFTNNPIAFSVRRLAETNAMIRQTLARPHLLPGAMTALLIVAAIVFSVFVLERRAPKMRAVEIDDTAQVMNTVEIDLGNEQADKTAKDSGVGAGDKGRVGFGKGKGEGSGPSAARAQGGGGGGDRNPLPASVGRLPVPSVIPAPISTTMARLPQTLPEAGIDIDPLLWKNLSLTSYGDPRSKSATPSNGPGSEGGIGTGKGPGIGEGDGPGVGPGRRGNIGGNDKGPGCCGEGGSSGNKPNPDPERTYAVSEVSERARVLSKPEPQYTEEARRNSITGTVILRVVFARTGEVTNIRALQSVGGGLTERAMAAARQIRFVPAKKNGQPVSMYMQLEYNFNLY